MATIRTQRNEERQVLVKDLDQRNSAVALAMRDHGSFYLPSATGSVRLQPLSNGCALDSTRHANHAKHTKLAWPGGWSAGCRDDIEPVIN